MPMTLFGIPSVVAWADDMAALQVMIGLRLQAGANCGFSRSLILSSVRMNEATRPIAPLSIRRSEYLCPCNSSFADEGFI
jgi:hypothetical protein